MGTAHTELQNMQAAGLPQALHERLLAAMEAATGEAADIRGTEKTLRRLRPAPVPLGMLGRLGVGMYVAAARRHLVRIAYNRWLTRAAAVLILGCMAGGVFMLGTATAVPEERAQVSRCLLNTHDNERVDWSADSTPSRSYDVTYEDAFVLDDGDTVYMARVPVTTTVTVPAEVL